MKRTHFFFIIILVIGFLIAVALPESKKEEPTPKHDGTWERITSTNTIRCGYMVWPPFVTKDPNSGALGGINVDVMQAVAEMLNLRLEWAVEASPGNFIEDLNHGRFDIMCASVWPDAGRIRGTLLTIPTMYTKIYLAVRANEARFNSYDDFNQAPIALAGIEGDFTGNFAKSVFPSARHHLLPPSADAAQLLLTVATGKADATLTDLGFFADYTKKNGETLKIFNKDLPVRYAGEALAVKADEYRLKAVLDATLVELINSGKIAAILKNYQHSSVAPDPFYPKP